jgi:hypothetical protein
MKRITNTQFRIVLVIAAALFCAGGVAWAQNAHFIKVTATLDDSNAVVSWKEAGLGDNQRIDYVASADGTATYNCVNNGGQCPNAANKVTVSGPVTATGTFTSGKNGSITASLTLLPPGPGDFSCPNGQTLTLSEVSFSNIKITDTTNNITQAATPSALSATLFVCP